MTDEFSLIKKIRSKIESVNRCVPSLKIPPGDDAALLNGITHPVVTTDCQRQNIHFRLDWQEPEDIGFKAVVVTLSDLAASYAHPVSLFVNLTLPIDMGEAMVLRLYDGICEALSLYPCSLGGGNLSSGSELALDLFAIGDGDPHLFPLRSLALPGEGLYTTGPLGLARAGLHALEGGYTGVPLLIQAFKRPRARFDAAEILLKNRVRCVMDISDGLEGDALHLAEDSNLAIRFEIDPADVPLALTDYCRDLNLSPVDMMLGGGEDYELLFTCDESRFKSMKPDLPGAFRVGTCLEYQGTRLLNPPRTARSYVHHLGA